MELNYLLKGEKNQKDIILLHGYLSCKESFIYQVNYLSNFFRVWAIDLSGFGKNPPLRKAYSLDDYILDLLEFLEEKNLKNFHIIAHSFGARLVLKSERLRALADKIVLTGGAGLKPRRNIAYYLKIWGYKLIKRLFPKSKLLKKFGSKEYKTLSPILKASYVKIVNEHLDYALEKVQNKTLIINGDKDKTTPKYTAKKTYKKIKGSRLVFLKGAGHFAFIDKKTEFNLIVKDFLLKGGDICY